MTFGDFLIRAAAWLSLTLYVASLAMRRFDRKQPAQTLWTLAYLVFLGHLACAFHFAHHWSHASVVTETARRSYEAIGVAFGEGVYVNYAFTLLWGLDVAAWRRWPTWYEHRSRWIEWPVQMALAFIWINATIVFGIGPIRWAGAAACVLVAIVHLIPRRQTNQ